MVITRHYMSWRWIIHRNTFSVSTSRRAKCGNSARFYEFVAAKHVDIMEVPNGVCAILPTPITLRHTRYAYSLVSFKLRSFTYSKLLMKHDGRKYPSASLDSR